MLKFCAIGLLIAKYHDLHKIVHINCPSTSPKNKGEGVSDLLGCPYLRHGLVGTNSLRNAFFA